MATAAVSPSPVQPRAPATPRFLSRWLEVQGTNSMRHAAALRPFRREEFGNHEAAPTAGHIEAANALLSKLRHHLLLHTRRVANASNAAGAKPFVNLIHTMLGAKED